MPRIGYSASVPPPVYWDRSNVTILRVVLRRPERLAQQERMHLALTLDLHRAHHVARAECALRSKRQSMMDPLRGIDGARSGAQHGRRARHGRGPTAALRGGGV